MRYHFPYVGDDLRKPGLQPGIRHCKTTDTGWRIMRYACLFPQLLLGTHSGLTTDGRKAQAEYAWVPGSAPRWFTCSKTVTHIGTNRA